MPLPCLVLSCLEFVSEDPQRTVKQQGPNELSSGEESREGKSPLSATILREYKTEREKIRDHPPAFTDYESGFFGVFQIKNLFPLWCQVICMPFAYL